MDRGNVARNGRTSQRRASLTVLLVEDFADLQAILKLAIKRLYYGVNVDTCSDGDEALRMYRERGPYTLVWTDLFHPGLSGDKLAQSIHKISPTQHILFSTTVTPAQATQSRDLEAFASAYRDCKAIGVHFLPKPFRFADLRDYLKPFLGIPLMNA